MRRAAVRAAFKPLLSWELAVQWRGEQFRTLQPLCLLVLPAMGGSIRLAGEPVEQPSPPGQNMPDSRRLASLVPQPGLGCWLF